MQANEKIIPKKDIKKVDAKRFFNDSIVLLNDVRDSASNIA